MTKIKELDTRLNIIWRSIAIFAILIAVVTSTFKIVREYDANAAATIENRALSLSNKKEIKTLSNKTHNIELLIARSYRTK